MALGDVAKDLWRVTLSQIESVLGRLEYLASLRNPRTGRYEHFGLEQRFGSAESDAALRSSHQAAFTEWLAYSLEEQKSDLDRYFAGKEETPAEIVAAWLRIKPFAIWVPANTRSMERDLFLADLDTLMEITRREHGVELMDPDA